MTDKKEVPPGGVFENSFTDAVKDSAQQIWLAGLGAFAKAQEEGSKAFETLVKEGSDMQRRTQAAAEERLQEMTSRMNQAASDMQSRATSQWGKFESIFEERVAKAMGRLGMPSKEDLDALADRLAAVEERHGLTPAPKSAAKAAKRRAGDEDA